MNANLLYLTAAEAARFEALAPDVRDGWVVEPETQTVYETPRQLRMRRHISRFDAQLDLRALAERADKNGVESVTIDDIPEAILPQFCFMIGARGVEMLLGHAWEEVKTDEDLQGIAALSQIRHELLALNAQAALRS